MRTRLKQISLAALTLSLTLSLALAVVGWRGGALAQVTFNVEGKGQGTIRIDLSLDPGSGVDRNELLSLARLVQRDLHSSGFFSLAILPPGATSSLNGWQQSQDVGTYRVSVTAEQSGAGGRTVGVDVAPNSASSQGLRRKFQVSENDQPLIGHTVSDILYEYFVGRVGYFATRMMNWRHRTFPMTARPLSTQESARIGHGCSIPTWPATGPDHCLMTGRSGSDLISRRTAAFFIPRPSTAMPISTAPALALHKKHD
jgi:hypothetical protein